MRVTLLIASLVLAAWPAFAHALLSRANPAPGSTLRRAPGQLDLTFTEGVVPHFSSVELLNQAQARLPLGSLGTGRTQRELVVQLPPLSPGQYTVVWRVTSEDTHKTQGRFTFTVAGP
jgi:methionine-rich copper-binding protein CopC